MGIQSILKSAALALALAALGACASDIPRGKVSPVWLSKMEKHETGNRLSPELAHAVADRHFTPGDSAKAKFVQQEDEFDPSTVWQETEVGYRHVQSGMVCEKATLTNELKLKKVHIFREDGLDVACNYGQDGVPVVVTYYATYAPDVSARDHAAAVYQALKQRFPFAKPAPMVTLEFEGKDDQKAESISFALAIGKFDGKEMKSSTWVAKVDGWHVKARGTYPDDEDTMKRELEIGLQWVGKALDIIEKDQPDDEEGDLGT